MSNKKDKLKSKYRHSTSKLPHQGPTTKPESLLEKRPSWRFRLMDMNGEWSCQGLTKDCLLDIRDKLCQYEQKRWKDIDNRRSDHPIPVHRIPKEAQDRLLELSLDDYDELYRLRLGGAKRLWGIRDHECFYILWWDPKHTVCPSVKKHT